MEIEHFCIVDMQGFCNNDKSFIPKEVMIINCNSFHVDNEYYAIIKPPFPYENLDAKYKKTATWLSNNYHNLYWAEGENDIDHFLMFLNNMDAKYSLLFVKGGNKAKYLRDNLENKCLKILDLSKYMHATLQGEPNYLNYCKKHATSYKKVCARHNAYSIFEQLKNEHVAIASFFKIFQHESQT
jgi:hypothetical protein